jgi:tetratricopeptide (TPR) repeat protein
VHDLNLYWKPAYKVARKHSSRKKLKEEEKSLIRVHLIVVNSVGKYLGILDKNLDRGLPEAISMLNEAVEVGEKAFPGSVLLADAYGNLAHSHAFRGIDLNQALGYYDKALNLKIACLGGEHLSIAETYYNIGVAYFFFQEYDSAISYLKKTLNMMPNYPFEETYLLIMKLYKLLGDCCENQGDHSSAFEYYEEALGFVSKFPASKQDIVASYSALIESSIKGIQEALGGFKK